MRLRSVFFPAVSGILLIAVGMPVSAAVITSVWTGAAGDSNWDSAANWSPAGVPNNGGGNTYNVTLNNGNVSLGSDITISNLDSVVGVELALSASADVNFTVTGTTNGPVEYFVSAATNSTTFSLGTLSSSLFNGGTLLSDFGSSFDISASPGTTATLQFNGANIVTNQAGIYLTGSGARIVNQSNADALTNFAVNDTNGAFTIEDRSFTTAGGFTNNGYLEVYAHNSNAGFTVSGSLSNLVGTTLASGNYAVESQPGYTATLQFNGAGIVTNQTSIYLTGSGARIVNQSNADALTNFAVNDTNGSFTIRDRNFTTAGGFTNNGYVEVDAYNANAAFTTTGDFTNNGYLGVYAYNSNAAFTVSGSLSNFAGTTLASGNYDVESQPGYTATLQFNGANIVTNQASITLGGTGARIVNQSNADALANFAVNDTNGSFTIEGRDFTTSGGFTNNGYLGVYAYNSNAAFTVSGSLSNLAGTTLASGNYDLEAGSGFTATLKFNGANIVTNQASITLGGTGARIVNQSNADALTNFAVNDTNGSFTIEDRNFTTAGGFTNNGYLAVNSINNNAVFTVTGGFTNNGYLRVECFNNDATFTVSGSLSNLVGTTLASGNYDLEAGSGFTATLKFNGANIVANQASITLGGTGARIVNQFNADALANFAVNDTNGSFTIEGRSFTTSGGFTNNGRVYVANGAIFTVPGTGNYIQASGTTELDDGTLVVGGTTRILGGSLLANGAVTGKVYDASMVTFGVSETLDALQIATTGTAVLTAHTRGAANVTILDLSSLTIGGTGFGLLDLKGSSLKGGEESGLDSPAPVPEPGTIGFMIVGALGFFINRCRLNVNGNQVRRSSPASISMPRRTASGCAQQAGRMHSCL